jgi:hypothetical protein
MSAINYGIFLQHGPKGWTRYGTDKEGIRIAKGEPSRYPSDALDDGISIMGKTMLDESSPWANIYSDEL